MQIPSKQRTIEYVCLHSYKGVYCKICNHIMNYQIDYCLGIHQSQFVCHYTHCQGFDELVAMQTKDNGILTA